MSDVLRNLSNGLADAVESAGKGVVRIEARRRLPATGIVWSADGIIVTAHHVVERDDNLKVGLPDGSLVSATLVGRDPSTDLAVLRAETKGLTVVEQADLDTLRVGHLVLAVGRPGDNVLSTLGVVSALGEGWRTSSGGPSDRFIQTDVAMYPGFSGGPLVDVDGHVLGLNTSAASRGISLTIPTATLKRVVDTLLAHGRVRQGYLGVGAQPVRLPGALRQQVNQETGLLIASVEPDSPAERGGLVLGDTLLTLNGKPLRQLDDLLRLLSGDQIEKSATLKIVRGGQLQEVNVVIGERS